MSQDFSFNISNDIINPMEEKLLGTEAFWYMGDELPFRTGGIPRGYITKPGFKTFNKDIDPRGYFSYGPYFENEKGIGTMKVLFFMDAPVNRRSDGKDAFTLDVVNAHDLGNPIIKPTTFTVNDLPVRSDGFIVYSRPFQVKPNYSLEFRVIAEGGCDLNLYMIRAVRDLT